MYTEISLDEAAEIIESFVDGSGSTWDWDDFTSIKYRNETLEQVRKRCIGVANDYRPDEPGRWCSDEGITVLRKIAADLRASSA